MLEKIKNNATAVLLVLSFGIGSYSAWSVSWIKVLKEKNHRLMQNNHQLMVRNSEYSYLVLGKDEFITDISSKYDSVLNQLKIKPKEVIRYIQRDVHNYIHDTVIISVVKKQKDWWTVVDTGKCFRWEGDLYKRGEKLELWSSDFDYKNKTDEVYFAQRPKKFLFIRYGKKKIFRKSVSECEGESVMEIEVTKKGD